MPTYPGLRIPAALMIIGVIGGLIGARPVRESTCDVSCLDWIVALHGCRYRGCTQTFIVLFDPERARYVKPNWEFLSFFSWECLIIQKKRGLEELVGRTDGTLLERRSLTHLNRPSPLGCLQGGNVRRVSWQEDQPLGLTLRGGAPPGR